MNKKNFKEIVGLLSKKVGRENYILEANPLTKGFDKPRSTIYDESEVFTLLNITNIEEIQNIE